MKTLREYINESISEKKYTDAIIIANNKALILRRAWYMKLFPGKWGFVGVIQKQFALTLVASVCISGLVALTLTPALCAIILRKKEKPPFWFVRKFNDFFDFSTRIFSFLV